MKRSFDYVDRVGEIEKKHRVRVTTNLCDANTFDEDAARLSAGGCTFDVVKVPTVLPTAKDILTCINLEKHDVVIKTHKLDEFSVRFEIRRERVPVQETKEFKAIVDQQALVRDWSDKKLCAPSTMDVHEMMRLCLKLARGLEWVTFAIREHGDEEGEWYSHVKRVQAEGIRIRNMSWIEYCRARCVSNWKYPCTKEEKAVAHTAVANSITWSMQDESTQDHLCEYAENVFDKEKGIILEAMFHVQLNEDEMDSDRCELRKAWMTLPSYSKDILLKRDMLFEVGEKDLSTLFVAIPLRYRYNDLHLSSCQ